MKRIVAVLSLVLAACTSAAPTPTTAPPGPTTTTTIVNDTCAQLAVDAADYLELVLQVLDDTPTDVFVDESLWPEPLVALEQQGGDLDLRAEAMRCDRGEMQTAVFGLAEVDPQSALGRYLAELLGLDG